MSKRKKLKYKIPPLTLCFYCEEDIADSWDHIIPVSQGGEDDMENLVPACMRCNLFAHARVFNTLADKKDYLIKRRLLSRSPRIAKVKKKKKKNIKLCYIPISVLKERPGVPDVIETRLIVPTNNFYVRFLKPPPEASSYRLSIGVRWADRDKTNSNWWMSCSLIDRRRLQDQSDEGVSTQAAEA